MSSALDGVPIVGASFRMVARRREEILFVVVGAWNTLFGYGAWAVLQATLGGVLPYLVIVMLAWPIAVLNAYVMHRTFVFRSKAPIRSELPRFSLVYVVTLVANLVVLPIAVLVLPLNIYVIQALFMASVVVLSFVAHKYYSFGGRGRGDDREPAP
jgi:putative flippase GtrA